MKNWILFLLLGIGFWGCGINEVSPDEPVKQLLATPSHFSVMPTFPTNPTTVDGVILGRKLFFDPALSGNNRISCETCHEQARAFTDGVALSTRGQSGNAMHRNSPVLFNLGWANNGLFWDGGAKNLESLIIGPITHLDEMGQNVLDLPDELGKKDNYNLLFDKVFPNDSDKGITTPKILKAIAQYIRTLNSANSKYDQYVLKQTQLSETELQGMAVFDIKCASCHTKENHLFTDNSFHNNGLDDFFSDDFENAGKGRYRITYKAEDMGKFKTPTLRNLKFSAPYMHDGRFSTVEQVLNHYSAGIKKYPTLDKSLQNFTLTKQEKSALLAFLETLNDNSFVENKLYKP